MMTLEPTVTMERTAPDTGITAPQLAEPISAEFVVSQIASNPAQPLNMGLPTGPADRRIMPAAKSFAMPETIRPVRPQGYPSEATASSGIRALFEKAKIDSTLVFEDCGDAYRIKAIVTNSMERVTLWSGMEIAKTAFADLLGRLQKHGFAEFATLGAAGSGNFDRGAFRAAFQAKSNEWITLVQVKSANAPDAITVVLSGASIQVHLPSFHSAGMSAAKAA